MTDLKKTTIRVAVLMNEDHAKQVAQEWLKNNPGYTWNGEWRCDAGWQAG
jgi:hypothetical protein